MKKFIPVIVIASAFLLAFLLGAKAITFDDFISNRDQILMFRDSNLTFSIMFFMLIYISVVTFSIPGATVLSVTGGFIFGLEVGLILNIASATIGATLLFLAVRLGFGNLLTKFEKGSAKFSDLIEQLKINEINLLLLLRLIPVVPFFVANILPAIAGVSLKNFFWTTFLGIIPGGFVFTLIGSNAGDFFDRGEAPDLSVFWSFEFLVPLICLIILVASPIFFRIVRYNHD
tara:strand:+ start:277 stop:969 length:693 start_codon:yes stop_codon:yes gene_type:complete